MGEEQQLKQVKEGGRGKAYNTVEGAHCMGESGPVERQLNHHGKVGWGE